MLIPKKLFKRPTSIEAAFQPNDKAEYMVKIPSTEKKLPLYRYVGETFENDSRYYRMLAQRIQMLYDKSYQLQYQNSSLSSYYQALEHATVRYELYRRLDRQLRIQEYSNSEMKLEIATLRDEISYLQHDKAKDYLQQLVTQLRQQVNDIGEESFKARYNAAYVNLKYQYTITKLEGEYFALQKRYQSDLDRATREAARYYAVIQTDLAYEQTRSARLQQLLDSSRDACLRSYQGLAVIPELKGYIDYLAIRIIELYTALEEAHAENRHLEVELEATKYQFSGRQLKYQDFAFVLQELMYIRDRLAEIRGLTLVKVPVNSEQIARVISASCRQAASDESAMQKNIFVASYSAYGYADLQAEIAAQSAIKDELLAELQREKRHNFDLQLYVTNLQRKNDAYEQSGCIQENEELKKKCAALEQALRDLYYQQINDYAQIQQLLRRIYRMQLVK